jgi:hypothetical protein
LIVNVFQMSRPNPNTNVLLAAPLPIDLRRFAARHADGALSANLASKDFVQIAVRDFARRERDASQINGRTALKNSAACQGSGQPTKPLLLSKKINVLQGRKSGSSIPLNVLGGYRWPNAGGVERGLLRKIVRAEIGDTR